MEKLNRDWFERELAKKCDFTISDIKTITRGIQEILIDVACQKKILSLSGLFKMKVTEVDPHMFWNQDKGEFEKLDKTYRVYMRASSVILNALLDSEFGEDHFDKEE